MLSGLLITGCKKEESSAPGELTLKSVTIGSMVLNLSPGVLNNGSATDQPITLDFTDRLDTNLVKTTITIQDENNRTVPYTTEYKNEFSTVVLLPASKLGNNKTYTLSIAKELKGAWGKTYAGSSYRFSTQETLTISSITVNGTAVAKTGSIRLTSRKPIIKINFESPFLPTGLNTGSVFLSNSMGSARFSFVPSDSNKSIILTVTEPLVSFDRYNLLLTNELKGKYGQIFGGLNLTAYSPLDSTDKNPRVSDDALMDLVQHNTLKYFMEYGHPNCGLALERSNGDPNFVTTGGSGFGIMGMIVGVERGWYTRSEVVARWDKMTSFLRAHQDFHGAWGHWMDGYTGQVKSFSADDNGGDLVETAFMIHGLITVRQYLNAAVPAENKVKMRIDSMVNAVEWDWYRQNAQNKIFWHWSIDKGWKMNMPITGWNEGLIIYFLAAGSQTHSVPKVVYDEGWARNGAIKNGKTFYGTLLPLGEDYGGPLFFSHYSFLGLDPRNLVDKYANYWTQGVAHSTINYKYCVANPRNYVGYSPDCWGLTASDNNTGYSAQSPLNDNGTISPTAALSSMPYTPEQSKAAMRFFYYKLGDRVWGQYGFKDAFNPSAGWVAQSYLAIDQGPIVVMMENYRTQKLWNLFMSSPEAQKAKQTLGFN
ncbi:MAG: glucoamylase family protein [Bacteroidota bacterium]